MPVVANLSLSGANFNDLGEVPGSWVREGYATSDLPSDRQLGLELLDTPPRGGQLELLISRLAGFLAEVDAVLLEPVVDRRLGHPERDRQLLDARARGTKLDHLTTNSGA